MAPPTVPLIAISLALSQKQLDWLDSRRQAGHLSRSAALRLALDSLIETDPALTPKQKTGGA